MVESFNKKTLNFMYLNNLTMKRLIVFPAIMIAMTFFQMSCAHPTLIDLGGQTVTENCDPDTVYFANEILPMLINNCAKSGCHNSSGDEDAKDLSSYVAVMNSGYVKAFKSNDSKIIESVTSGGGEGKMPPAPNEPLSSAQVSSLETWINQGARNNECSGGCDTTNVTYSGTIAPLMNNYCTGCHGNAANTTGINLTNYLDSGSDLGVKSVAENGKLWGSVNQDAGFSAMPLGGNRLQDCKIDELRIWLDNGYPNN